LDGLEPLQGRSGNEHRHHARRHESDRGSGPVRRRVRDWIEIVTDRVVEDDGIFLVTSGGRPLFFFPDQPVRVPPDVAAKVRTWREAGWRR
jgi:hypothetical protein